MRSALILACLFALEALGAPRVYDRNCDVASRRSDRGGVACGASSIFFEFATASGAGMGTECSGAAITSTGGTAIAVTHGNRILCTKRDYTLVAVLADQPVVMSGRGALGPLGLLVEGAATTLVLDGTDLSTVNWTRTAMTCVASPTSPGPTLPVSVSSRCTATAVNATVCQTITTAAAVRSTSAYVQRVTGTGAISVARNGTTYTDFAPSLSSAFYRRLVSAESPGCAGGGCIAVPGLTSSIANPQICFRIAVSGDSFDVGFVQDEANASPTSPIYTAYSVTRLEQYVTATLASPSVGNSSCRAQTVVGPGAYRLAPPTGSPAYARPSGIKQPAPNTSTSEIDTTLWTYDYLQAQIPWPAGAPAAHDAIYNTSLAVPAGAVPTRITHYVDNSKVGGCVDGSCATSARYAISPTMNGTFDLYIGDTTGISHINGVVSDLVLGTTATACKRTLTSPDVATAVGFKYVALGDSITKAPQASTSEHSWPRSLEAIWGPVTGAKYISNLGRGSQLASYLLGQWTDDVRGRNFKGVVTLGGINDITQGGNSAAVIFASLKQIYDEAGADGLKVYPMTILCASNNIGWDATKQTKLETVNTSIRDYVIANPSYSTLIDIYADATLCTGTALAAAVDSGDGLHPNQAGSDRIAVLVNAAIP